MKSGVPREHNAKQYFFLPTGHSYGILKHNLFAEVNKINLRLSVFSQSESVLSAYYFIPILFSDERQPLLVEFLLRADNLILLLSCVN